MNTFKTSILAIAFVIFVSCDCLQHVQGIAIDAETQQPITGVIVQKDTDFVINTDSIGNFEFTTITGGLFGCPKISLSFEKEGYEKTRKRYKSCCADNNVIMLEKQLR